MAMKPDGNEWRIREQIIEDRASGLTLQFEVMDGGRSRLLIVGGLPFGNREIIFDHEGREAAAGTALGGLCRPSWLRDLAT